MNTPRFTQILQDYGPTIRRYLNRKCNNLDDVDDLYQECVCAIFQALPRFAGRSSVSTWIFGICRNVFSNYIHRKKRDLNLRDRLLAHAVNHNSREPHDLRLLIDRLPAGLQKLHRLYYVEGLSVKEISIVLDKAEGTIKYLLYRLTPVQNRFKKLVAKVLRCDHGDSVKQNNRDSHIGGQDHGTHSKYV